MTPFTNQVRKLYTQLYIQDNIPDAVRIGCLSGSAGTQRRRQRVHRMFARYVAWRIGATHWADCREYTYDPSCPLCQIQSIRWGVLASWVGALLLCVAAWWVIIGAAIAFFKRIWPA